MWHEKMNQANMPVQLSEDKVSTLFLSGGPNRLELLIQNNKIARMRHEKLNSVEQHFCAW